MLIATVVFFAILTLIAPIFGKYIAFVYGYNKIDHQAHAHHPQTGIKHYLLSIIDHKSQTWSGYFGSLFSFNLVAIITTFCIIYFQELLPLKTNLEGEKISFSGTLNAAISFATGTFWQSHNPETQLSMFSQIFALGLQNFLSAGTGIAVLVAFSRGVTNNKNPYIGNFYIDFLKANVFILLPIALLISLWFVSQSVPYDISGITKYTDLSGHHQTMFVGPAAGQVAIKNLAANGGSIFFSGSAHPFEAPNHYVIITSLFLILLMPAALIFTYGYLINQVRLSWSLYIVIIMIMSASIFVISYGETKYGLPLIMGEDLWQDNFNYTGKELIYEKFPSLMWILSITMSSSGSVNACLENYSPVSTLVLFFNLVISKFILEGAGSGFCGMLAYLIIAIFVRGLITGSSTNFFGKKITVNEINYVLILFLLMPIGILLFTSITLLLPEAKSLITHQGSQAITDITYNFASTFSNNGSALTGLNVDNDYFNYMTALAMFIGRYPVIYFSLALSGSFANKKKIVNALDQSNKFSIELSTFLVFIVILVGAITFLPLMILGPVLELFKM